jgi:hypothetical protein
MTKRAHTQRCFGCDFSVDLNHGSNRWQMILVARRGQRFLEKGLKVAVGPSE